LRFLHYGFAAVAAILGVADAALGDYAQIITTADGPDSDSSINPANAFGKIHLAYTTVYCAVALEMFACVVFLVKQSELPISKSRVS